jgi:very-short-patch-repair endonuclease
VPAALRTVPFNRAEARIVGITRSQLRGAGYRRLGAGLYRWAGLTETPHLILTAAAKRVPAGAAFSGRTAGWLHGLDLAPCDPIEVTIPEPTGSSRLAGASVHRAHLARHEIVRRRGLATTSAIRTVVDLGGREPLTEGVVAADLFLHAGLVSVEELRCHVVEHPGARGIARLRRVVDLVEPKAESAMETRLRMLLVLARLPRPEVQVSIHDDEGRFLGRPDLLYPRQRLAIEYDGGTHRERMVDDNRRQNGLVGAGLRLLRFTAADVYGSPDTIAMQVRHNLARGA